MARALAKLLRGSAPYIFFVSRRPRKARSLAKRMGVGWLRFEELREADLVVLTAPSAHLREVALKVAPYLKLGSTVMDISSVKKGVIDGVARALPDHVSYVSLHPLFSPRVRRARGRKVVVTPARDRGSLPIIVELLRRANFHVVVSTPEEHDRAMAFIQVAHHLPYLAYAITLWESLTPRQISDFATRSLEATLLMIRRLHKNLNVVKEIHTFNIYGAEGKAKLLENLRLLAEGDEGAWGKLREVLSGLSQVKPSNT